MMKKCLYMFSAGTTVAGHNYTVPKPELMESADMETHLNNHGTLMSMYCKKAVRPKSEDK